MLSMIVGRKTVVTVIGVLAVILIMFLGVQYIQDTERTKIELETLKENVDHQTRIEESVKDAIQNEERLNPNRDPAIALERMRERNAAKQPRDQ